MWPFGPLVFTFCPIPFRLTGTLFRVGGGGGEILSQAVFSRGGGSMRGKTATTSGKFY